MVQGHGLKVKKIKVKVTTQGQIHIGQGQIGNCHFTFFQVKFTRPVLAHGLPFGNLCMAEQNVSFASYVAKVK